MTDYNNNEIDLKFTNLLDHMKGFEDDCKENFERIIEQTTKTNGTVQWLTKIVYLAIGGLGVLSIIVFPLLFALIQAGRL